MASHRQGASGPSQRRRALDSGRAFSVFPFTPACSVLTTTLRVKVASSPLYKRGLEKLGDELDATNTLQAWRGTLGPSLPTLESRGAPQTLFSEHFTWQEALSEPGCLVSEPRAWSLKDSYLYRLYTLCVGAGPLRFLEEPSV